LAIADPFTAYIDEAGDEGFFIVPRPDKKSSEWFLMSAVVVRADKTVMFDNALQEFRAIIAKNKEKSRNKRRVAGFHFRDARHHDRLAFLRALRGWPFAVITVATHKPSVRKDSSLSQKKHALFQYTAKLLVERISWYCSDHMKPGPAKLVFAERGQLDRDRLVSYFRRLKTHGGNHSIRWKVIDPEAVEVVPASKFIGLQVADAAVSSVEQALELSWYSTTEHRYVKMWKSRYYRSGVTCSGYGMKAFPNWPKENPVDNRMHWLRHFK
jgi:hypothetical protein